MKKTKLILISAFSLCVAFHCTQFVTNAESYSNENTNNVSTHIVPVRFISGAKIEPAFNAGSIYYTGSPITPDYYLVYNNEELVKGIDYTVTYTNNVNSGYAYAKITGIGKYTGSVTQYFYIKRVNINSCTIYMDHFLNVGSQLPEPQVSIDNNILQKDVDYVVEYDSDPMSAGEHKLCIVGINNIYGTYEFEYWVEKASLYDGSVTLDEQPVYNGKAQKPLPVVTVNGKTLKNGVDYKLSYSDCVNAGTAKVKIEGINNYSGTIFKYYTIKPKHLSNVVVERSPDKVYTGKKITPTPVVKADGVVLKSSDYTVVCNNNIEPGTVGFKIRLNGNYTYDGVLPDSQFKIVLGSVSKLASSPLSTNSIKLSWAKTKGCKYKVYRYDQSSKKYKLLKITADNSFTDKKLSEAKGYTYRVELVYGSHTGKQTVIKTHTKISAPKLTLISYTKKAVLKWDKKNADGYEIKWCKGDTNSVPHNSYYSYYYFTSCYPYSTLKNVKGKSNTTFTKTKLTTNKNYHFAVRAYKYINGKKVYSGWSNDECTINTINRLNAAKRKTHSTYKTYNVQGKITTSTTHTLTSREKVILGNFARKHFKKGWTASQKVEYTAEWIRNHMRYGNIPTNSYTENIFVHKEGQCSDYNGALVEMMVYLGYNADLIMGNRSSGGQHFWGEIKIDGTTYLLEVGEKRYDGDNYKWKFLCLKYSEADNGYKKNGKIY